RPQLSLLPAAVRQRQNGHTLADEESADPLRAADLVCADREHAAGKLGYVHADLAERLYGVGVEGYTAVATSLRDLPDRLNRPYLVVPPHHAHDARPCRQCLVQRAQLHAAFLI